MPVPMMKSSPVRRLRALSIALVALGALFVFRLFYVQVVSGAEYSDMADRQYLRPALNLFNRGSIYFSQKDGSVFSAATVKTGYLLAVNPRLVTDPEATYAALTALVPLDRTTTLEKITKNDPYEELANRLDEATADRIQRLALPGVSIYKERWRVYPAKTLGAHVIGFMGYRGTSYEGRYGIEKQYERVLARPEGGSFINFFAEVFGGLGGSLLGLENEEEGDVVLTIEPTVQAEFERELERVRALYGAELAAGIITHPQTGEVVAMAATPTFDPGARQSDIDVLKNPLTANVYEMGSIVKPLTLAAALDAGVITPETTYTDKGTMTLDGKRISNYDGEARGVVPMQEVLNQSLNLGAAFAMTRLGRDRFRDYFYKYGLAETTGIDLPDEGKGLAHNLESPRDVEYATASFGQGIAWTPIAITRALGALGNGGLIVRPHVVKRLEYRTGLMATTAPTPERRVLSPEASETITRMLVRVVDEALAGGTKKLPRYTVAAKTGTAQIADPDTGGYYEDRYLHSFFGYFPAYDPKFLIFMYIVNPRGVRYASETLTEPFFGLTKFLLNYYDIPPDR